MCNPKLIYFKLLELYRTSEKSADLLFGLSNVLIFFSYLVGHDKEVETLAESLASSPEKRDYLQKTQGIVFIGMPTRTQTNLAAKFTIAKKAKTSPNDDLVFKDPLR